jgi:hypothetical protein
MRRLLIPIETTFIGQDVTILPSKADWEESTEIKKYTLNALSTYESSGDIASTIRLGPADWYLSSVWNEDNNPVLKQINKQTLKSKPINFYIRIVCEDSFGDFYYSDWSHWSLNPSQLPQATSPND